MPIMLEDGVESGNVDAWDGTNVTTGEALSITSVNPLRGKYSLLCESVDAGPDEYATVYKLMGGLPIIYARGEFKVTTGLSLPAENDRINLIMFMNCANIAIGKAGGVDQFQLRVYDPGASPGWVVINTGIPAEIGKKYEVQLAWETGDVAEFYLNGELVASQPLAGLGSENTAVNDVRFGLGVTVTAGHAIALLADTCAIGDQYIAPIAPPSPIPLVLILAGAVALGVIVILAKR